MNVVEASMYIAKLKEENEALKAHIQMLEKEKVCVCNDNVKLQRELNSVREQYDNMRNGITRMIETFGGVQ